MSIKRDISVFIDGLNDNELNLMERISKEFLHEIEEGKTTEFFKQNTLFLMNEIQKRINSTKTNQETTQITIYKSNKDYLEFLEDNFHVNKNKYVNKLIKEEMDSRRYDFVHLSYL